jgi:predicted AAA+ superfamily ATPase
LFENYVVSETNKILTAKGENAQLYFVRTSKGEEIDLLIEKGMRLYPYEIKLTKTPKRSMIKNIDILNGKIKNVAPGKLVCLVKERCPLTANAAAINAVGFFEYL